MARTVDPTFWLKFLANSFPRATFEREQLFTKLIQARTQEAKLPECATRTRVTRGKATQFPT